MARVHPTLGSALSPAEVRVLMLLSEGWTQAEVGARLGIAKQTVREHVSSILPRMGAANALHAAVLYERGRRRA